MGDCSKAFISSSNTGRSLSLGRDEVHYAAVAQKGAPSGQGAVKGDPAVSSQSANKDRPVINKRVAT